VGTFINNKHPKITLRYNPGIKIVKFILFAVHLTALSQDYNNVNERMIGE
jgi:hypothetical protein